MGAAHKSPTSSHLCAAPTWLTCPTSHAAYDYGTASTLADRLIFAKSVLLMVFLILLIFIFKASTTKIKTQMRIHWNNLSESRKFSLIILNSDSVSEDILSCVWPLSNFRVCADGGANRLYDTFSEVVGSITNYLS